jgi:hypothetical protein
MTDHIDDNLAGTVRYRVNPGIIMARIRNPQGLLKDYRSGTVLPEWLRYDEAQCQHLLDVGIIEYSDEAGRPTDPGRVWECVSALIACDVPEDAGRPRAAAVLHENGMRYSNETMSKAIAIRKSGQKYEPPK